MQGGIGGEQPLQCSIVPDGMYVGNGGIFASGSLSTRAKMPSLQICRPEIRRISGKSVKGVVLAGEVGPPPITIRP